MPQVTPQQVLTDPQFQSMDPSRKMAILNRIDPAFTKLSPQQQMAVIGYRSGQPQQRSAADVEIPPVAAPVNTDRSGGTSAIQVAQQTPATGKAFGRPALFNKEAATGRDVYSIDNGATWHYSPRTPDPDAFQKWSEEQMKGFLTQAANFPRALWEQSIFGQIFNPEVRKRREKELEEEHKAISQPGIMPGIKYVASHYLDPRVIEDKGKPTERINWGGTAFNVLPYALAGKEAAFRGLAEMRAIEPPEAARRITNLVKPDPLERPGFESDLAEHLDKIGQFVADRKLPLKGPRDWIRAVRGTYQERRNYFYQSILDPVGDRAVSTTGIPGYQGGGTQVEAGGRSGSATLNQLDQRLTLINAELDPMQRKVLADGGAQLRSEPELRAERQGIRDVYYRELGKATGIDPKELGEMRETVGALGDLAGKSEKAFARAEDEAVTRHNVVNRASINPFAREGQRFAADIGWQKLMDATFGDPYTRQVTRRGKQIGRTLKRARTKDTALPGAANLPETAAPRGAPIRGGSTEFTTPGTPEAEQRAQTERIAAKIQQGRILQPERQRTPLRATEHGVRTTVEGTPEAEQAAQSAKIGGKIRKGQTVRGKVVRRPIWEKQPEDLEELRQWLRERTHPGEE